MAEEIDKLRIKQIQDEIKRGNQSAFTPIIELYQGYVFQICNNILRSVEDAEEVTQDVFVKVFQHFGNYKGDSKFSTWIYRIAHNLSLNQLAKMARNPEKMIERELKQQENPQSYSGSWEQLKWDDRKKFIGLAMKVLTAEEHLLITLYYMQEQSMQEIAEITALEANTCKVKIHRSRKKLEGELNRLLKEEVKDL